MKPSAIRIERMLEKIEARLVPPPRKCLQVIIHEGEDDEAEAMAKALAEHVARHPEDVGRAVEDFNWIEWVIVHPKFIIGADGRVRWPAETIEEGDTDKDTDASETLRTGLDQAGSTPELDGKGGRLDLASLRRRVTDISGGKRISLRHLCRCRAPAPGRLRASDARFPR